MRSKVSRIITNPDAIPFFRSKCFPPSQKNHLIERKILGRLLEEVPDKKLVILQAPAGYGKSTLLSQCYARLISDNHAAGWLSLDDDDNNALTLLSYLLRIVSSIEEKYATKKITQDKATCEFSVHELLALLVHRMENFSREIFLILDNFEVLDNQIITTVIKPILQHAPANLHVLIASRFQQALQLSRWWAQGLLYLIKASELRFNRSEIKEFFQGKLLKHEINTVVKRTEGWPVVMQAARFWDQHGGSELLGKFSGVPEEIAQYFSEQVLSKLSGQAQQCLFEVSILDVLTAEAIKGIFNEQDYWSILNNLESLEPFLSYSADRDAGLPGLYHLNPIFHDYLRMEFERRLPGKKRSIHHTAAVWFAANNQLPTALRHANESHDEELAGRIVQDAGGLRIWISQGLSHLATVHRLLDKRLIQCFPRLKLLRALILLKEGDLNKARNLYEEVKHESFNFTVDNKSPDVTMLKLDALVVESTLLVNECKVPTDNYLSDYESVVSDIGGNDELLRSNVMTLLCLSYHQKGEFDKSLHYADRAISSYGKIGMLHGQIFNFLHEGVVQFTQGHPKRAIRHYERALLIAKKYYGTDKSKILVTSPLMAEVYYETNDLHSARLRLRSVIKKLNTTEGWFDVYAAGYITSARIILHDAGLSAAVEFLDSVEDEINLYGLVGLMRIIQATRISFLSRHGLFDEADYRLKHSNLSLESCNDRKSIAATWREREAIIQAIAELSVRRRDSKKTFHDLLEISENLLVRRHIHGFIRTGILACLAGIDAGYREQAWKLMTYVLDKSLQTGFIRFFIEQGIHAKKMLELFGEEYKGVISRRMEQHRCDIIAQFELLGEKNRLFH